MDPEPTPDPFEPDDVDRLLSRLESEGVTPSQAFGGSNQWSHGPWHPPTPEELQELIPQYKVLDLVGRGGMGAVYRGWQSSLERYVAIKILTPDTSAGSGHFSERFKQEAKTMAKFHHPGIVSIHDAGETRDGLLYIVMEFIEGIDVSQMMQAQGKLPPAYALAITAHVCDALQYAHSHGVIHRDIKPANVLMNSEGEVKVADFGLARSDGPTEGGMTQTNMTVGTPDYVAPEALIHGIKVDGRADLYAVGVMLYAMLTGQVPRGMFELPSVVTNGETDERFDAIVAKAMEPAREKRYQTAAEIRQDLDVILTTPKLEAHGPSSVAIPKHELAVVHRQMIAQKPVARRPGMPTQRVREVVTYVPVQEKKSKLPVFATVAVLAVGSYFGWQKFAAHGPPAAAAASAGSSAIPIEQPAGTLTFGGHRYLFVKEPADWETAKVKAESMHGHLATLTTKEEKQWAYEKMLLEFGLTGHVIIGGRQTTHGGPWTWVTGEPFDMSLWERKPDGSGPFLTIMRIRDHLEWDDVSSNDRDSFLVEWDDLTTPIPATSLASVRPASLDALLFGGHRYKFFPNDAVWSAANKEAVAMGGHLVTLTTREEDEWVRKTFLSTVPKNKIMHLGGVRASGSSQWSWVTGEPWSFQNQAFSQGDAPSRLGLQYFSYGGGFGKWTGVWNDSYSPRITDEGPDKGEPRIAGFLVEWDTDQVESALTTTRPAPADALLFSGHRYKFIPGEMSWNEANEQASIMGGHLVTLTSEREDLWVRKTFVDALPAGHLLFIGGIKAAGSNSPFRWSNGEPWSYTNWGKGPAPKEDPHSFMVAYLNYPPGAAQWASGWPPTYKVITHEGQNRIEGFLVEWDTDAVESPLAATLKPSDEPVPITPVNLLAGVDVKRDALIGKWEVKPEGLVAQSMMMQFNQAAPDEYDLDTEFTPTDGTREIELILPLPTHIIVWMMGRSPETEEPTFFGFGPSFDGIGFDSSKRGKTSAMLPRLKLGQRYRCVVEVRKGSLRALLDGQEIIGWSGDLERLSIKGWSLAARIRSLRHPGLVGNKSGVVFHKAELRPKGTIVDKLAELEAQFKDAYERDVTRGTAGKALTELDKQYLAAVNRALAEAQKSGNTDDVTALQAEKQRVSNHQPLPAADPVNIAVRLAGLRDTYRKALAPLIKQRDAAAEPVYDRYDKGLAAFQADLAGKGEALSIQILRETLEKKRHPAAREPEIVAVASVPPPAPIPAPKPGLAMASSKPAETAPTKENKPKKDAPPPTLPPEMLQEAVPKAFSPMQAIEWALSLGGSAKIKKGSVESEILSLGNRPKGTFTLIGLKLGENQPLHVVSLAALAELPELRELVLDDNLITDAGLSFLPKFPKLTDLRLNGCGLTDAGLVHVAKQSMLTHLGISNNAITGSSLRDLAALQAIHTLEIGSAALADENIPTLASFGTLTTLDLAGSKPLNCTSLAPLASLKALKRITLGRAATDAVVQSLGALVQIDTLDLNRAPISDYALERIGSMKGLRELNLYDCRNLTDIGFAKLQPLKGLLRLNVAHTRLTDSQFAELSMKLSELSELNVNSDGMSDAGLAGLVNLRKLSRLVIHVRMCTDLGLGYVRRVAGLRVISIDQIETLSQPRFEALKRAMPGVDFGKR